MPNATAIPCDDADKRILLRPLSSTPLNDADIF
jgi:hypothetical protein